jgi:hypothetical protein
MPENQSFKRKPEASCRSYLTLLNNIGENRIGETPALTQPSPPGEGFDVPRVSKKDSGFNVKVFQATNKQRKLFPLPAGEGQGEGENWLAMLPHNSLHRAWSLESGT